MNFKNIMNGRRNGETIAETIIALSVLAIGITMSAVVMGSSLGNVSGTRNRLIAVNIAREAIEGMRNIRDTNWLRFSGDKRACWNHLPQNQPETCSARTPNRISSGNYILYVDDNYAWRLTSYSPNTAPATAKLFTVDINPAIDSNGDTNKTNDDDLYNHVNTTNSLGRQYVKPTLFSRVITISYLNNDDSAGTAESNRMRADVTVSWNEKIAKSVTLSAIITDYLDRENLND